MIAPPPNTMQLWFMDRIELILQELEDLIKVESIDEATRAITIHDAPTTLAISTAR
jgi:hypothetical protein